MPRLHRRPVLPPDLGGGRPVFACQRFEQGGQHHPVQAMEPGDVLRQQVVVHQATVSRLIHGDDGVVAVVDQLPPVDRLAFLAVLPTVPIQDLLRYP